MEDLFVIQCYEDATAAMRWLARTFGFQKEFEQPGSDGRVVFAHMRLGEDVIGTGSVRPGLRHGIALYVED